MDNPVLVDVMRGGAVESVHRGAFAIVDADGALVFAAGDVDRPVFPRSAIKLLQALPLVASGAADALQLGDAQLALACASHNGEPEHAATAAALLAACGADASLLACGTHWPLYPAAAHALAASGASPCALHNNCSGKHAGFVCLGHVLCGGADLRGFMAGYVEAEHAVMREVTAAVQATTGADLASAPRGTDGCSIPTFGIALRRLALAFARVGSGVGLSTDHASAARRLRHAIAREPHMVAGTGRFDTLLMQRLGERVCCKVGAEGVYCAALPERGLGVAIKLDDGNTARAAEVVMAALTAALLPLDDADARFVQALAEPVLRNWNGVAVGALRPAGTWPRAASAALAAA